jgi:hypothetical protein
VPLASIEEQGLGERGALPREPTKEQEGEQVRKWNQHDAGHYQPVRHLIADRKWRSEEVTGFPEVMKCLQDSVLFVRVTHIGQEVTY